MCKENIDIEMFVDSLSEIDPKCSSEVKELEKIFNCKIQCDIEKHNQLQYTYYYEIDFKVDEKFFVEIESGINNGTQVNSEKWGYNTKPTTRIERVLKDIILDTSSYDRGSFKERKAQAVLNANKSKLFEYHRKNN